METDTDQYDDSLDDEDHLRPTSRRFVGIVTVCLLAASAVFLVGRAGSHPADNAEETADPSTPTTTADADDDAPASVLDKLRDRIADSQQRSTDDAATDGPKRADGARQLDSNGHEFLITVPDEWTVTRIDDQLMLMSADEHTTVSVSAIDTYAVDIPLDQVAQRWEQAARAQLAPDLQVTARTNITVGGLPGLSQHYTATAEGEPLEGEIWWLLDDGAVWVVNHTHDQGTNRDAEQADAVARSLRPT